MTFRQKLTQFIIELTVKGQVFWNSDRSKHEQSRDLQGTVIIQKPC